MKKNKSLFKNSIYNIIYKCLNVVFPLISSVYVARILMSEGIGIVASAQNIVAYFTIIASLGIPTYGIKKIAENKDDIVKLSNTFYELFIINLISTLVCAFCYYLMININIYFADRKTLYIICGINVLFNIFNIDWFYQGIEEYKYIMMRSIMVKILSLIAMFLFIKDSNDYIFYALISSLALVLNYCFNIIHIFKIVKKPTGKLFIVQHIKPVLILLGAVIAVEVYTLADTTMLSFICGDKIVGLYTNSMKIIKIIRSLVVAICAVFLPRLSYFYSKGQKDKFNSLAEKGIKILIVFSLPATVGLILLSSEIIPLLFGPSFLESIETTRILSVSVITVAFSNFFGHQILVTVGKEKSMMYSTFLGACINVSLNSILIPLMNLNGAAIASVITEAGVALFQIICVRKILSMKFDKKFISTTASSIVIMSAVVIILKLLITNDVYCTILSVLLGASVYMCSLLIQKNEISLLIYNKLKRI